MQAIQLLQIGHLELSGALGRRHRRRPQEDRCRYRQAHGRKISRSDEHPSSVQGPPREACTAEGHRTRRDAGNPQVRSSRRVRWLLERDCDISRPVFWAALFCSPAAGRHSRSQQLSICGRNSVVPDREEGPKRSRYPEQPVQRHRLSSGHSACRRPVTRASTHGGNSLSDY
nr:hypothetical protein [Sinorhizobium meliloti]